MGSTINGSSQSWYVSAQGVTVMGKVKEFTNYETFLASNDKGVINYVVDATGDTTVNTGSAVYIYENGAITKIYETESMDQDLNGTTIVLWENIVGKPESSVEAIDEAVTTVKGIDTDGISDAIEKCSLLTLKTDDNGEVDGLLVNGIQLATLDDLEGAQSTVTGALSFKGVTETVEEFPTTGNTAGDIWVASSTGKMYVYTEDNGFVLFGDTDTGIAELLDNYYTKSEVAETIATTKSELEASITVVSDSIAAVETALADYATKSEVESTIADGIEEAVVSVKSELEAEVTTVADNLSALETTLKSEYSTTTVCDETYLNYDLIKKALAKFQGVLGSATDLASYLQNLAEGIKASNNMDLLTDDKAGLGDAVANLQNLLDKYIADYGYLTAADAEATYFSYDLSKKAFSRLTSIMADAATLNELIATLAAGVKQSNTIDLIVDDKEALGNAIARLQTLIDDYMASCGYATTAAIETAVAEVKSELEESITVVSDNVSTLVTKLSTDYDTSATVDEKISAQIASVLKYQGAKETFAEVEALTDMVLGDVWHVTETGAEFAYDGTTWQELGSAVDLDAYYEKSEVDNKLTELENALSAQIDTLEQQEADDISDLGSKLEDVEASLNTRVETLEGLEDAYVTYDISKKAFGRFQTILASATELSEFIATLAEGIRQSSNMDLFSDDKAGLGDAVARLQELLDKYVEDYKYLTIADAESTYLSYELTKKTFSRLTGIMADASTLTELISTLAAAIKQSTNIELIVEDKNALSEVIANLQVMLDDYITSFGYLTSEEVEVKVTELEAKLDEKQDKGDYALKSEIPEAVDLSAYVTSEDLTSTLGEYALKSELPEGVDLSAYVTSEDLDSTLSEYVKSEDLDLSGYVKTEDLDLSAYVTSEDLDSTLSEYVKSEDLDLSGYVKTADLDLSGYVTAESLNQYVTNDALTTTLADYAKLEALDTYLTKEVADTTYLGVADAKSVIAEYFSDADFINELIKNETFMSALSDAVKAALADSSESSDSSDSN